MRQRKEVPFEGRTIGDVISVKRVPKNPLKVGVAKAT